MRRERVGRVIFPPVGVAVVQKLVIERDLVGGVVGDEVVVIGAAVKHSLGHVYKKHIIYACNTAMTQQQKRTQRHCKHRLERHDDCTWHLADELPRGRVPVASL